MTKMNQKAINYAKAIFELNIPESDLMETREILEENPELMEALYSPAVRAESKHNIIDKIFPKTVLNFLKVLTDNGSIKLLFDICEYYSVLKDESDNRMSAELIFCDPPNDKQIELIKEKLLKQYGKSEIDLTLTCDKSLIGGFIIKTADNEIDRSIKGRLTELSQKFIRR